MTNVRDMRMRYVIFTPGNVKNTHYLFAAMGLTDSKFMHDILCELDFDEYSVQFTYDKPRATKNRIWWYDDGYIFTP